MSHGRQFSSLDAARILVPCIAVAAMTVWAARALPPGALTAAVAGLGHIAPWRWCAALILTAAAFAALGRLEAAWHHALNLNTQPETARRTGRIAMAIGQAAGAASVVAAVVRWRLLRTTCHPAAIAQVAFAASLSFALCHVMAATVALWWVALMGRSALTAPILAIIAVGAGAAIWRWGPVVWRKRRLAATVWACCMTDMTCAGLVFALMVPPDLALPQVTAVFILALGAGFASHMPLGLGAFDIVILALLPAPVVDLLPALLAFRLVYFVLPGVLGLLALRRPHGLPGRDALRHLQRDRAPAIWGLATQGASVWQDDTGACLIGQSPIARVVIGAPLGRVPTAMQTRARYKCNGRTAAALRDQGWTVALIAEEALIDPLSWSVDGPEKSCLRRKLRQAQAAGVAVIRLTGDLPLADMSAIAQSWAAAHGGERGFSMGRYTTDLRDHEVFGIYTGTDLRGFVTFLTGPHDWCLDLCRYGDTLPPGAMQMAIVAALSAAKADRIATVSLAAVMARGGPFARVGHRQRGLVQFKAGFGPRWRPLYHAAPHRLGFISSLLSVTWAIQRPAGRLVDRLRQLSFPASHARQSKDVRTAANPDTRVRHDTRLRPTSRRARLDPRRWRNRDEPVQHGPFVRRRARDVERGTS